MRQAYAHRAVLTLEDGDERAPGGAITAALCGEPDHAPPCPLAPHHTTVERTGDQLHLTILFVSAPDRVEHIRDTIDAALDEGSFRGTRWRRETSGCMTVPTEARPHARRLFR